MATGQMNRVFQHLHQSLLNRDGDFQADGQLLDGFIRRREEAAIQTLILRHGPMVLAVCRRILRNHHDAEDAFQATFLVLVRKATTIIPKEMVANWLYGVACNTALNARALAARPISASDIGRRGSVHDPNKHQARRDRVRHVDAERAHGRDQADPAEHGGKRGEQVARHGAGGLLAAGRQGAVQDGCQRGSQRVDPEQPGCLGVVRYGDGGQQAAADAGDAGEPAVAGGPRRSPP